jgi:hypothetical protein
MPLDGTPPRMRAITDPAIAAIIKGMALRGDNQHDIAAWFGLNNGRVNELLKCSTKHVQQFRDVPAAPEHALPPPGPYSYFTPRPGVSLADQFQQALAGVELKWAQALAAIREELRITAAERRLTNEKLDQLQQQLVTLGRALKLIETPTAPTITRRNPLGS